MKKEAVILSALALLCSCSGEPLTQQQLYVDSRPVPCAGEGQFLCLRVKHSEEEPWVSHHGGVHGFDYAWGYHYTLSYIEHAIENPPADGSSAEWVLLDVISAREDEVGEVYRLNGVELLENSITYGDDEYSFIGQAFDCPEDLDCGGLLSLSGSRQRVDLVFSYLGNAQIQLVSWR